MNAPISVPGYPKHQCVGRGVQKRCTHNVESVDEAAPSDRSVQRAFSIGDASDDRRVEPERVRDPVYERGSGMVHVRYSADVP